MCFRYPAPWGGVIHYRDREGRSPFREWFLSLKNNRDRARINARLTRIAEGVLGDYKSVEGGIFELRFFFGSGYRIYFAREGQSVIILLCGGDKSSQKRDIRKARSYRKDYLERRHASDN